jgi:hypothetical protein
LKDGTSWRDKTVRAGPLIDIPTLLLELGCEPGFYMAVPIPIISSMKKSIVSCFCLVIGLGCLPGLAADDGEAPSLSTGGLPFGNFYYVPSHHSEAGDGAAGLVLRRGYLTFDADFEELSGPAERKTLQAFVAYQTESLRLGLQYSNQDRQENPPIELAWAFMIKKPGESRRLAGRIDRLIEPSPSQGRRHFLPPYRLLGQGHDVFRRNRISFATPFFPDAQYGRHRV